MSNVYEPGSVFKMMTAATALEAGTVTRTTRIKDVGTLRLDHGETKIDNADHKGMGWITFEDGIAYSRNVVAAKVALGLGEDDRAVVRRCSTTRGARSASGRRPVSTSPARRRGSQYVRDPAVKPWSQIDLANGAFGQGVAVTPDPARDRLRGAGQRRARRSSRTSWPGSDRVT